jgi:SAM-dependent methyltransferase
MSSAFKGIIRRGLNYLGYEITRRSEVDALCEGFNRYLVESTKAGMDVNDWIEERLGWEPALPLLKKILFPYLDQTFCVCEIGPGTGRHARHIQPLIGKGELHLLDHSSWIRNYLTSYFSDYKNIYIHDSDGVSVDLPSAAVDLCFSNGTFIELKLGTIMLYAEEFWRILKKSGYAIFDYIDVSTEGGWQYLKSQSPVHDKTFTYHCGHTIDKVFTSVGFTVVERHQDGKSTYVVFQKK